MSDHARGGWLMPVLLAVTTSTTIGFAFLYLIRPSSGELGAIRVVVSDEEGKPGSTVHVVVAEAPFAQKDTVGPGPTFTGVVHYPAPYRLKPHLKLTCGKRPYRVAAETEVGFTWVADGMPDDFKEPAKKEEGWLEKTLNLTLETALIHGRLKPGLTFEGFTWEAKGLRAPPSALPPTPFEQKGAFNTVAGQEGMEAFMIPYDAPPNVQLSGKGSDVTAISEVTAKHFKWRNSGKDAFWANGSLTWTARGVLGAAKEK